MYKRCLGMVLLFITIPIDCGMHITFVAPVLTCVRHVFDGSRNRRKRPLSVSHTSNTIEMTIYVFFYTETSGQCNYRLWPAIINHYRCRDGRACQINRYRYGHQLIGLAHSCTCTAHAHRDQPIHSEWLRFKNNKQRTNSFVVRNRKKKPAMTLKIHF